jgi:uncharacterized membrane protein
MEYLYAHRLELKSFYEENENEEVKTVFNSDFLAHLRLVNLLGTLVGVLCVFMTVVTIFFATKAQDVSYLPHALFSAVILGFVSLCVLYLYGQRRGNLLVKNAKVVIANYDDTDDTSNSSKIVLNEA